MTIVCGTDFSDDALQASEIAAAIARKLGVPLQLVHVIDELGVELTVASDRDTVYDPIRARVRERAAQLRDAYGVPTEPVIVPGHTVDKLNELAEAAGASLVVVGALGRERKHRWLLGSVAERVAQTSRVPVLVVRDGAALGAWARGERSLRVLVGVEPVATAAAALRWAAGLRRIGPCDLLITQVAWPSGEHHRLGVAPPMPLDRLRPEIEAPLRRDLERWAGAVPGPGETSFLVRPGWGRVDAHLVQLATELEADLVVVGTHQRAGVARLWQGSVSRGVLHGAATSVACVPRGDSVAAAATLPQVRRVLAPTDFSPMANAAIPFAYALAGRGGIVHLLHVVTRRPGEDDPDPRARLQALVPASAAERGIETAIEIVTGADAGKSIWQAAGRLGVDAICMATHGRTGVARWVLGSQAQEVVANSRKPVVLVPMECDR